MYKRLYEDNYETGRRIRSLRKQLNLTQTELGLKVGAKKATIARYEDGSIQNISLDVLKKLSVALETTPEFLIGWTGEMSKPDAVDTKLNRIAECRPVLGEEETLRLIALVELTFPQLFSNLHDTASAE